MIKELTPSVFMAPVQQQNVVLFRLEKHIYAVLIDRVRQIIDMVTISPIPQVSHSVSGMINFHGTTVPVIHMRRHLGLENAPLRLHTPIILVTIQERLLGLLVDDVIDVLSFASDQLIQPQEVLPQGLGNVPLIRGLIQTTRGMVIVLELDQLFNAQQSAGVIFEAAEAVQRQFDEPEQVSSVTTVIEPSPVKKAAPVRKKAKKNPSDAADEAALLNMDAQAG